MNKRQIEKRERNKKDKQWRIDIMSEYNGECVICGNKIRPNAHHIIPRTFKETRWDVKNGIILCPLHHRFGKFSAHKNALWFINWLRANEEDKYKYLSCIMDDMDDI